MYSDQKLHSLQALRALAAWFVVADHAILELTFDQPGNPSTHVAWVLGSSGVYIFFVISGFIMVHICWNAFGAPAGAGTFLRRRIIRIVPLYWLASILTLAYHRAHGMDATALDLIRSMAFIPFANNDGLWAPVLGQGWTLNYEMMFYLIFAFGLWFRRPVGMLAIVAVMGTLLVASPFVPSPTIAYLGSPIILWFVLGMGLAVLWRRHNAHEPRWLARAARRFEPFGDASYSTYLVHGICLTMLLRLWLAIGLPPSAWIVPASLVAATIGGLATYRWIEKPMLRLASNTWRGHAAIAPT